MKKKLKVFIIILIPLLIVAINVLGQYNKFNNKGINGYLIGKQEEYYNDYKISNIEYSITKSKKSVLSKVYYIESDNGEKQIRFRILLNDPFYKNNIIKESYLIIRNEKNIDIGKAVKVYPETFWFYESFSVCLAFNDKTYLPEPKERLKFTLINSSNGLKEIGSDANAYVEIELLLP